MRVTSYQKIMIKQIKNNSNRVIYPINPYYYSMINTKFKKGK